MGVGARLIVGQHLLGLQQVVAVNGEFIDVAFERIAAQTGLGVVGADAQIGRGAAVFRGLQVRRIECGAVGVHRHTVHIGCEDALPLVVAVAARITVVGDRFPGEDQMLPLAHGVIGVGVDIRAAAADTAEHAEVPAVPFGRGVGGVGIALEDDPAGASGAADKAVVDRALAPLLVLHRTDPEFDRQGFVGARIVTGGPGQGGGRVAVAIMIGDRSIVVRRDGARSRMSNIRGVGAVAGGAGFAKVHGDVGAGGLFVQMQVHRGLVGHHQVRVGDGPVGVGRVLVVGEDLFGAQLGGIEGELVDAAEIRIEAGARRIVVIADGQGRLTEDGNGGIMIVGVGGIARLGAVATAGPSLGDRLFAVDVHGHRGIHHVLGVIDDHHVGPLAQHVGHAAEDIEAGAAAGAAEHAEIPADPFAAIVVGVGLALEEHPALTVDTGIGIAVVDRALAVPGLVAGRVEPGLEGERLVVLGVQRGVPGDFGAGGEVEEGGPTGVARDGPGHGVHAAEVLGGDHPGSEARVQIVGAAHGAVAEAIVGGGAVGEDGLGVVGGDGRSRQGGQAQGREANAMAKEGFFHDVQGHGVNKSRRRSGSVLSAVTGLLPR